MKLFLRRLVLLILPITLVLLSMEIALRCLPNAYKVKSYQLNTNATSIETLALGSSHTLYAINPKYFTSKTFNAANISQSPDVDMAILNTYSNQFKNLKTIVVRLSYDTLFEELKNSNEEWRLKDYKLYTDIELDYSFKHHSEILSMGTKQSLKVLKDYYLKGELQTSCDSMGWGNNIYKKPKIDIQKAGEKAAKRHTATSWELLKKNIDRFEKLMLWSAQNNVNVYVVTFPAYKSYRNHLNENQLKEMIKVGENLQRDFSNCKYYNLMNHIDFKEEDFYDGDHLNSNGAKKISLLLNRLIEN